MDGKAKQEPLVPAIQLPKGGGALQGIGETFQANAVTGTGAFSVPIAASPGRGGFGPQLALAYDSGVGNGPFGLGWTVGVASIRRKTQLGVPRYEDESESDTFVLAGLEDLVPARLADGSRELVRRDGYHVYRYRPRIEGAFARIERWVDGDGDTHWRVVTGDNVTTIYGATAASRIADPTGQRVFEWLVERSYDDKGNLIVYEYRPEDDAGIETSPHERGRLRDRTAFTQRYLERVCYGGSLPYLVHEADFDRAAWERDNRWYFELVFDYGQLDGAWPVRRDPFSSYRAGFEIRTYRLCRRVLMFHHFAALGPEPQLVRSTVLVHDEAPVATQLREVVHVGHEPGRPPAPMPGVRFTYSAARISDELRELPADQIHALPDGRRSHWLDLEGEGLTGILAQRDGGWFYQRNTGDGGFDPPRLVASVPSFGATTGGGQLIDLDGNGRLDYVCWSPGIAGSFELAADAAWKPFVPFAQVPNLDLGNPQLRLVDLTGDGHPDLVVTEDDCLCWYPSEAKQGYGAARRVAKALDDEHGPAIVFADATQSIFIADMCGDGLAAIVRIRNGEICYWPNLGYGRFGAKVTMSATPYFDEPARFDPRRIRLGDIDGTGTSDIFYLGDTLRYWRNEAGNGWSDEQTIASFPRADSLASVQAIDLLGTGTACLAWTSTASPGRVRYLPLMTGGKPYLLTEIENGMGATTSITYAPSTKFYLADRRAGRPWITRLPFPVHVVERIDTHDAIGRNHFVALHAYHHGYFDGLEREFRGFGLVERWDTEQFSELADHVPPVLTKTWFHNGWYEEGASISRHYAAEYYAGDPEAWALADTSLPAGLSADEQREACRALKGRVLRSEVYALDGTAREPHPYAVVETRHQVRLEQARSEHAAVFYVWQDETLTYHYERDPADPRIAHALALAIDRYGTVLESAAIAYPRRRATLPEQQRMAITYVESDPIHLDGPAYRIGLPFEQRTFELRGVAHDGPWTIPELRSAIAAAAPVAFTAAPAGGAEQRLLSRSRVRYYGNDLEGALPFGEVSRLAIPYEAYTLAFTGDILAQPALGDRITPERLREGGYRNDIDDPTTWWIPSGVRLFGPGAAERFYVPSGARDPFGAESRVELDPTHLFTFRVTDPLGNTTTAEHDYRVLAPVLVTDANRNRTRAVFDTRGLVIATAVMGKREETDPHAMGDSVADHARLDEATIDDVLADPRRYLQAATTVFHYDLFAWRRDRTPPVALAIARCQHVLDAPTPDVQLAIVYSDGFGRAILTKLQAEDGLAPAYDAAGTLLVDATGAPVLVWSDDRWVGNGATVFNNKGLPVRSYEPFFDGRPDYTHEDALVRIGVGPTLEYDPLGRVVRTVMPDLTLSRVEFDPWQQTTFDPNDTVLESPWFATADRAVADKAAAHANTPARVYLDTLGRPFVSVAHNRRRIWETADRFRIEDELIPAHTELDATGQPVAMFDGRRCEGMTLAHAIEHRGNTAMTYAYAMGGLPLFQDSMDAGPRWSLVDVTGKPIHAWDVRGHHTRTEYDALRRPTHVHVDSITVARTLYGEAIGDARNLRGKPYLLLDGAGLLENHAFDFKGNLVEATRRLVDPRRLPGWPAIESTTPDWSSLDDAGPAATPLLESETFTTRTRYDALNRAVETTSPDASVHLPGFNKANLLEAVRVRLRGATEPTDFVEAIDYDARGKRTSIRYANGVETAYTYDRLTFRLSRLHSTHGASVLQDLHYTYDPAGNVVEVRDDAIEPVYFRNEEVEARGEYTYDALYRLIEATGRESAASTSVPAHPEIPQGIQIPAHDRALRNYRQLFDYDPAGNLLTLRHVTQTARWTRVARYDEHSNRLASTDEPASYTHDVHGNLLALPHLARMDWDYTDHLAHVAIAPHDDVAFTYDTGRQRVRKLRIKDGNRTERIYLGAVELYRRYTGVDGDPVEQLETLHVMDDATRICMVETPRGESSRFRFQLGNHLGSATIELDEAAAPITYEEYHPYGTTAYHARNGETIRVSPKRYRYTGMERDEETGLAYHTARYYAPWLARWCSADPAGTIDGLNLYRYTNGQPVGATDRSGMEKETRDERRFREMRVEAPELVEQADALAEDIDARIVEIKELDASIDAQQDAIDAAPASQRWQLRFARLADTRALLQKRRELGRQLRTANQQIGDLDQFLREMNRLTIPNTDSNLRGIGLSELRSLTRTQVQAARDRLSSQRTVLRRNGMLYLGRAPRPTILTTPLEQARPTIVSTPIVQPVPVIVANPIQHAEPQVLTSPIREAEIELETFPAQPPASLQERLDALGARLDRVRTEQNEAQEHIEMRRRQRANPDRVLSIGETNPDALEVEGFVLGPDWLIPMQAGRLGGTSLAPSGGRVLVPQN